MSEDPIKLIKSLIESGQEDTPRLELILGMLQNGEPLNDSDHNYLQGLVEKSKLKEAIESTSSSSPEEIIADTNIQEEKSSASQNSDDNLPQKVKIKSFSRKRVATVAAIIAVVAGAYMGFNAYAVSSLEFRPHHGNQYMMSQSQVFIQSDVCNPSYFPASFSKYEITAFYKSYRIETAEISGSTIAPKTYERLNGVFTLNMDSLTKLQQENFTFDPSLAHVTTTVSAPFFGIIPFSVVKNYGGEEFQKIIKNGPPGSFSC